MNQGSIWGDLDPEATAKIKADIRQAVAEGIAETVESGHIQTAISQGLTDGLRHAAADPELIDVLMSRVADAFTKRATEASGRMVIGGVLGAMRRGIWIALLSLLVYSLGGWSAVSALWKYLTASQS